MKHVRAECKGGDSCGPNGCNLCNLFLCSVCGGAEGSLPTDCLGTRMNEVQQDDVYAGRVDYREGRGWVVPDGTGTSIGDMEIKWPSPKKFTAEATAKHIKTILDRMEET